MQRGSSLRWRKCYGNHAVRQIVHELAREGENPSSTPCSRRLIGLYRFTKRTGQDTDNAGCGQRFHKYKQSRYQGQYGP